MTPQNVPEYTMHVRGEPVAGSRTYAVRLPYDGSTVAHVHEGDLRTLDRAIEAARSAALEIRRMTNEQRSDLLLRVRSLLEREAGKLARILSLETGKPIREARIEVDRGRQTLMAAAIAARELAGEAVPIDAAPAGAGRLAMTVREPLGVVGAITPWNVPLNLALHKIAPAIAGGNAVVHKPSEITPLSALELAALVAEAGAPAGAYNVVTGDGAEIGQGMVRDPRIAMITFTGSVEVGKQIRANAGLKRVTLELGGNCPVVVEPDADLELAAKRCAEGGYLNSGQLCISVQRIFVHERVEQAFLERLRAITESSFPAGHPLEDGTMISSMITEDEAKRVEAWIDDAVKRGARRLTGGERRSATLTPCVIEGLPPGARISCDEVFGPVIAVERYTDLDDAIRKANGTAYGLQAGVFTRDIDRAFRIARALEAGGVIINDVPGFRADHMPYGGSKESGIGREGPRYSIEEMTEVKLICWR
jgi:acyl-CoA reductase-like NAD-dependent aldehyde dehydrogenase